MLCVHVFARAMCVNMISRWLCVLAISVIRLCVVQAKIEAPKCPKSAEMLERCTVLKPWRPEGNIEYTYLVDGNELTVYMDGSTFSMGCKGTANLDNPALPRLDVLKDFTKVKLYNCKSQHLSYSEALIKLNVTVSTEFDVSGVNGLSGNHLTGFTSIDTLEISNSIVADDAFQSTPNVIRMRFKDMRPPAFNRLPESLEELQLINPGTVQIESNDFKGLLKEFMLIVLASSGNTTVKAGSPLKNLTLSASFVFLDAELVHTLNKVTLIGWGEIRPSPWKNCNITSLYLRGLRAEILPDNWIADCTNLSLLELEGAKSPLSLAKDAFKGAKALKEVTLKLCKLQELPTGLFRDAVNLEVLDLSGNFLRTLPCMSKHLKTLKLSNNNFTSEVFATISSAEDLKDLDLQDNIHLGTNICNEAANLHHLVRLNLRNTNVRRICNEWRQNSPLLEDLNLSQNKITYLRYADLQFTGSTSVIVNLTDNNVTHLEYEDDEYSMLNANNCKVEPDGTQSRGASRAVVQFSQTLQCGCKEAWTALAMKTCPEHVSLNNVDCVGGAELSKVDFENLACPAKKEYCPRKCHCKQVLRREAPIRVIHVMCEHANLTELPTLPSNASVAWKLHLAYNSISFPLPKHLPPHVLELNLIHNGITQVEVVTSLLPQVSRMYLSGNELDCSCGTEQGLADLRAHPSVVADFRKLKCNDGAPLVVRANCERGLILGSVLGLTPVFLAIIVFVICLVRPSSRLRIKLVLRGLGIVPYPPETHEGKDIDVFLACSHLDYEKVGKKIQQWLESGKSPYKTLVLQRDWLGGAWIPEHAKASVRVSKRIVVVVSKQTLTSEETLTTFYHAHAVDTKNPGKQPRLVVILLDDIDRLPWNEDNAVLRRYLTENPHLCWSDAWFWTKFRAALAAHSERNRIWTRVRNALHLSYGSSQSDVEGNRMELTQSMSPAEILDKAIAESNRNEMNANLDAIQDELQPQSI